ncbi:MAG: hypothetical protein OXH93_13645 [Caldilineaceae bacterium]|nr:hypothetical protein [Caldilineaceae bacterium]
MAGNNSLKVSPEGDTIALTGDFPGVTLQSRLGFEAYDCLHGSEQVACQILSIQGDSE